MHNKIAVLDFGGQYTHLIARRIRQLNVYSEIYNPDEFKPSEHKDLAGIIFSGGPHSVTKEDFHKVHFDLRDINKPLLGICYGHQLIASMLGGVIESSRNKEYGFAEITLNNSDTLLFKDLPVKQTVWMSHGDHVVKLPHGFRITASSDDVEIVSYESESDLIFGMQFHPEVVHTEHGLDMLNSFLDCCVNEREWKPASYKDEIVEQIRKEAQDRDLFLLLSGGVDSLVALALCIEAVGSKKVYPLHVDTGFMRLNESSEIMKYFTDTGLENLRVANAEDRFMKALYHVIDPEEKRKIIGRLFVDVLNDEIEKIGLDSDWMLVQGTIYPDTIESGGSKKADKIKTHHNRVEEIEKLIEKGLVIEPLKDLYKDEVRKIGYELGLPQKLVDRHPFPGPGLAIRVICSSGDDIESSYDKEQTKLDKLLETYGMRGRVLPIRSVGVQGDFRTYHHPAVIWYDNIKPNWDEIKRCASRIVNNFDSINRVVYSHKRLSGKLNKTKLYLEKENLDLLRKVDSIILRNTLSIKKIWQLPVVSLPLWNESGGQCFVMRPVTSQDAMTADVYEMDFALLSNIINITSKTEGVGCLFYDVTTKPPATIEWE